MTGSEQSLAPSTDRDLSERRGGARARGRRGVPGGGADGQVVVREDTGGIQTELLSHIKTETLVHQTALGGDVTGRRWPDRRPSHTHTQTGRQTEADRQTGTHTHRGRQTDRSAHRQTDRQTHTQRQTDRHTDKQTDRQKGRQTDRQKDG